MSKGNPAKRFPNIAAVARRKARHLEIAGLLEDLRVLPGNRAEEFLRPLGISQYRLSKEIGVPAQRIGQIVKGKCVLKSHIQRQDSAVKYRCNQIKGIQIDILHVINSPVRERREIRPRSNEEI